MSGTETIEPTVGLSTSAARRLRELITAEGRSVRQWPRPLSLLDLNGIADGCYVLIAVDANKSRAVVPLIIQRR